MKIIPLKEGNFAVSKNKEFEILHSNSDGKKLKMAIQPFIVITEKEHILLDAGLGWQNNGVPIILELIEKEGVDCDQISKILLSHLHKDHVAGLIRFTDNGYEQNFPKAEIYIQKREYEFAMQQEENPSFNLEVLELLKSFPNVIWIDNDKGKISEEISYEMTGGHTPFHQSFWIRENNETVFYGADNLPQRGYVTYQVAYKTDHDGKKALELRQEWIRKAKEEQWSVLLYHDMKMPILRF